MKAILIHQFGSADNLKVAEIPQPEIKPGHVLIEVHAASINPIDEIVLTGKMAKSLPPLPFVPGFDVAGVIKEVAGEPSGLKPGDRVFGQASVLNGGSGSLAQLAAAKPGSLALMPANMDFLEAASIALTGTSAVQALYDGMNLQPGQDILIHGGSGGIGSVAIQIARHLGAHVATTATGKGIDFARKMGADEVIDYKNEDFEKKLSGFDAVLDTLGGDTFKKSLQVLKKGGIIVSLKESDSYKDLPDQYGVKAVFQFTKANTAHLDQLRTLIEQGIVKVYIDQVFDLQSAPEAYKLKDSRQVLGKIAIRV